MEHYNNYHSHKHYSNVKSLDSIAKPTEYIARAIELDGNKAIYFTTEHGYQGNVYEAHTLCNEVCVLLTRENKKYTKAECKKCEHNNICNKDKNKGIKLLVGAECYYVTDRKIKDKSNYHLIIIAKNKDGYKDLNRILSQSNVDGIYYKNRIDDELLFSVNPNNVIITTACFDKNMDVLTSNGIKKISDVKKGEMVLTIDGTYKQVEHPTMGVYKGNMHNIKGQGIVDVIRCTDNHKFLKLKDGNCEWTEAKDLREKDDLLTPIDFKVNDIRELDLSDCRSNNRKVKKRLKEYKIKITGDLLELLGVYCAEGSFLSNGMGIRFTLNSEDNKIKKIVEKNMYDIFGLKPYIKKKKNQKAYDYEYSSTEIFNVFSKLFKSGAKNKDVPQFIKYLNPTLQMRFIKGLYIGDGNYNKRIDKRDNSIGHRITLTTISKNLVYSVIHIFNRNYISPNITIKKEHTDRNDVHHQEAYYLDINSKLALYLNDFIFNDIYMDFKIDKTILKENHIPLLINDVYYMKHKIKNILKEDIKEEVVYCLSVKDNHNFVLNNVLVHNCVGGRLRDEEGLEEWIIKMKKYFGGNFYLEVQNHNEKIQNELNEKVIKLSNLYDIPIIHGNDSHYIYPSQSKYRDLFLKAKDIIYKDESNFILDYPTYQEVVERYLNQGILSENEIHTALKNTHIFDNFESLELDKEIKMPHISSNPTKELKDIINKEWKIKRKSIPKELHDKYLEAIRYEFDIIEKTNTEEYFIMDYKIVDKAVKDYDGLLTKSGRGSASSFIINKILGLTEMDRLVAKVPLYPTRFMSVERILSTKSLPDFKWSHYIVIYNENLEYQGTS